MIKKMLLLSVVLTFFSALHAQLQLGDKAVISILTSSPSDEAVFTVYGHTSIRVNDTQNKRDLVFNYGIFDFSKSNFIYRFAKGETDYQLGVYDFLSYIVEYEMRGSKVTEQMLNLSLEERARIWNALVVNMQPENVVYRYNFFFDNCATRPVAIIENNVNGKVIYQPSEKPQTFRQLINYSMRNQPWLVFGCQLALGSPCDRIATQHEEMFLPSYLKSGFATATIQNADGVERKLVAQTSVLLEGVPEEAPEKRIFTPFVCCLIFLFVILGITYIEWKKKTYFRVVDCLLFFAAGVGGVILFFLCFASAHPATCPNWLLLWLHPFHLIGVISFAVKKQNKVAYYYHFINFAALTLMLLGWDIIPQQFNTAFIPLVMSLWVRSGSSVYRNKKGFK